MKQRYFTLDGSLICHRKRVRVQLLFRLGGVDKIPPRLNSDSSIKQRRSVVDEQVGGGRKSWEEGVEEGRIEK